MNNQQWILSSLVNNIEPKLTVELTVEVGLNLTVKLDGIGRAAAESWQSIPATTKRNSIEFRVMAITFRVFQKKKTW